MAGSRTLKLKVLGDAKGATEALAEVKFGMSSITKGVLAAGAALTGAATAVGTFAYKAIQQASDLQETQSKVNVIFGDSGDAIKKFASTAAGSLGQSKQTALDAAATFGIFGKSAGLAGMELANFSTDFVKLSADLASFNNTTPQEAIQAIGAALRGESEPLRKYGVLLNDAAMRQKAMELGIYNGNGALTSQQKILAAQALIYEQTADAQGDFERTSDGLANQQRILRASIENLTTTLGTLLLPYFQKVINALNKYLTPAVEAFSMSLDSGGSFGQAINFAIASMGDFGKTVLDVFENVAMGTLTFIHDFAKMGETVAAVIGIVAALSGNVSLALKATASAVALGVIRNETNAALKTLPGQFDKWRTSIDNARDSLHALKNESTYFEKLGVLNQTLGEKVKVQKKSTEEDNNAANATGGAAKAVDTAQEKLKKYTTALKDTERSTKSYTDSQKEVKKANEALTKSTQKTADAQAYLDQIRRGYGTESKQATVRGRELAKAQRELESAGYNVEESLFAVKQAEKDLAEVRKDPESTPDAIREAEIKLAEAKLRVADTTDSQRDATEKLAEAERLLKEAVSGATEDSDTYTTALDKLNQAKLDEIDASERVETALYNEREATQQLEESKRSLWALMKEMTKGIISQAEEQVGFETPKQTAYGSFLEAVQALHPNAKSLDSKTPMIDAKKQFPNLFQKWKNGELVPLAEGGVVTRPTMSLIGEAGAEAVIPLNKFGDMASSNVYVTINAGMGADGAQLGQMIIDEIKKTERFSGKVFAAA
jgi:hypothetical protein